MFHTLQEEPSELHNLQHFLHHHQKLFIFIWPILIQINSFFDAVSLLRDSRLVQIYSKTSFDKIEGKALKLRRFEKANFAHFVRFPLGGNLLIYIFWQKWRLLKALKLKNLEKANFTHFVSFPIDGNLLMDIFWQNWRL